MTLAFAGLVTNIVVSMVGVVLIVAARSAGFAKSCRSSIARRFRVEPARRPIVARAKSRSTTCEVGEAGQSRRSAARDLSLLGRNQGRHRRRLRDGGARRAARHRCCTAAPGTPINMLAATAMANPRQRATPRRSRRSSRTRSSSRWSFTRRLAAGRTALRRDAADVPALSELCRRRSSRRCSGPACCGRRSSVINPVLDARIEWRWFVLCQIAFGVVAGLRGHRDRAHPHAAASAVRGPHRHRGAGLGEKREGRAPS